MAVVEEKSSTDAKVGSLWMPFWHSGNGSTSSSSQLTENDRPQVLGSNQQQVNSISTVARSLLSFGRRLRLVPASKLYFPYEPGKLVRSAVRIKNTSKSHVAFKFQTTEPKSCFMRPAGGVLSPGESIIATVFKFVERPEISMEQAVQKSKAKFKIMSLKVKEVMDYVPELFDEQKDQAPIEQILRVVYLDPLRPSRVSSPFSDSD